MVTILIHSDTPELFEERVRSRFPDRELTFVHCRTYDGIHAALEDARPDIVLSHKFDREPYPGRAIADAPSVRWIHAGGTGVDHFAPWDERRLVVTNSPGLPRLAMSEYAIGAIYALNQNFPRYHRQQLRREWRRGTVRQSEAGTLVVVGLGRIGRAVCARAKAAGMSVIGVRRRAEPIQEADEVIPVDRLHEALARADYLVVIVPLTEETRGLIDAAALAAMKPGALVVNISRGGVVVDDALVAALESGQVRGACLDVFETEPLPEESPFWDMENVIVTPHVAGFVDGWQHGVADLFCDNLERWLAGKPLNDTVDPRQGY